MRLFRKKTPELENELRTLEKQLAGALQPVFPRPEFVSDLRKRLHSQEIRSTSSIIKGKISNGLLVAGGLMGSVLMIITSIRGLISLVSLVGLIVQYLSRGHRKQQATPA